jgi:hypothetical protein
MPRTLAVAAQTCVYCRNKCNSARDLTGKEKRLRQHLILRGRGFPSSPRSKKSVKLMAMLKSRSLIGDVRLALHFFAFIGLAFLIFSSNSPCLFFTLDGLYLAGRQDLQAISRTPFTQLGADPIQGSFDAYEPVLREYFLPNLLAMPFMDGNPDKATTYTIYAGLMILSVYLLGRALRVHRAPALFAGLLYPLLTLPMFIGSLPMFWPMYAVAPHVTQVTSLTLLTLACVWAPEEKTFFRPALLALAALFCTIWMVLSSSREIVLAIPALLFFGVASLLAAPCRRQNIPRMLTGVLIFATLAALGILGYIYGRYKYTATAFFSDEFFSTRSNSLFASIIYHEGSIGWTIAVGGIAGAVYSAVTGSTRLRVFALAYLAYTVIFHALGFAITQWAAGYAGPSPIYFEFLLWPMNMLFTAIACFAAIDYVTAHNRAIPLFSARHNSVFIYSLLGLISLSLLAGNALATFNGRFSCVKQFSPTPTPITEYLQQAIAFHPESPFRGLVATFTGYQERSSVNWADFVYHDHEIWEKTGNDHRTVGLWHYNIPTLLQFSSFTTPQYYLMLSRFLSRPKDRQMRSMIVLTRPDEKVLKLWGVRFVIADFNPGFGTSRGTLPVSGHQGLRLVELDDFNRGQYSPTKVIKMTDFRSALEVMRDPLFDGSQEVVTDANVTDDLRAAGAVVLTVEKDGLSIRASSSGQSLLVLPAQFSHCWSVHGNGDATLFRANIMQLGIAFKRSLDVALKFHYGPILAGQCRLADLRDMEHFDLHGAR